MPTRSPLAAPIRVLVVDDSASVRQTLCQILATAPDISVLGTAADPFVAARRIQEEMPDVIILDLEMPRMDGLTFLRKIMAQKPIPVIICSTLTEAGSRMLFEVLEAGAVDVLPKPRVDTRQFLVESSVRVCDAVRGAARSRVRPRHGTARSVEAKLSADAILPPPLATRRVAGTEPIVCLGASTGGTEALRDVLEALPMACPGIVVVQHMPEHFTAAFARRLDGLCALSVKEAEDGDAVLPGRALIAPGGRHLLIQRRGGGYAVAIKDGPLVSRHRPSVDVMFRSAAQAAGGNALGILMTGMGDDGANGLLEMRRAGALTIAQDEESCVVFGMPKEAIERGAAVKIAPLDRLHLEILRFAAAPPLSRSACGIPGGAIRLMSIGTAPSGGLRMRALLVDDSPSSLRRLSHLVEEAGTLTCVAFTDPWAALDAARTDPFDLVLVDYVMPGLDGIELTRHLRRLPGYEQIPIVMVTSSPDERVRIAALEAGATDFLSKSPDATEIRARLRNMISLSTALRRLNDQAAWLAGEVEAATRRLLDREEEIIFRLSLAVEYRDNDTGGHTYRVARYSALLAEQLGLPPAACRAIFLAAPLHDVGKVAIPDAILLKPGRLDSDEFAVIREHAAIGERVLGGSTSDLIQLAAEIAGGHHERWDGKGYPHGLTGRLIPLAARIVAIADVFDALTTERPYKTAMTDEEAFAYIAGERGGHFDPLCVDAFLAAGDRIRAAKHERHKLEPRGHASLSAASPHRSKGLDDAAKARSAGRHAS